MYCSDVSFNLFYDVSEPDPAPETVSAVQGSPKLNVPVSRQPFASTTSVAASDDEDNNSNVNEDEPAEEVIQTHVAREGVVSGRVYRKSVVVGAKPKAADAPPEKEGYLMKKSPAMLVGWQKRYFLTNANGDIEYYKTVSIYCITVFAARNSNFLS